MHQAAISEMPTATAGRLHQDESIAWQHLRKATRPAHDAIENNPYLQRLLAKDITKAEYARILAKLAAFYGPLEQEWLRWAPLLPSELQLESRACKTALLLTDLAELNEAGLAQSYRSPVKLSPFRSPEEAWGWIYVIEGSTLGGQLIAKALAASLGVTSSRGAAFYSCYGLSTGLKWQIFKTSLNEAVVSQALDLEKMSTGAMTAFSSLDRWMAANP